MPSRAEMERAFFGGDASYDGVFYTGVRTTGIFCRPSCTARKPKPRNIEFFGSVKDVLFAGYRACLRCKPLESGNQHPSWLDALMARIDAEPTVKIPESDLRAMGLDPARVRRYFASRYGLTFQAYCRARRLSQALESIKQGGSVDDAVFDAGYESHSGFREAFARTFGATPGDASKSGSIHLGWIDTPLGPMIAGASDQGVVLLEFTDRRMLETQLATVRRRFGAGLVPSDHPHLTKLRAELDAYFAGTLSAFSVPLVAPGSPFEERVWAELLKIPYGETRSYEDVAVALQSKRAVRAVGTANGRNRIAIVIPCHRVVNKSGELGGYGGGLWRKRRLLHLERTRAL
jgi:AraC family transcriptional regulator, regulatory protein of adaptative response / methylated-DNA-[protein]-cysteine methyltransferase